MNTCFCISQEYCEDQHIKVCEDYSRKGCAGTSNRCEVHDLCIHININTDMQLIHDCLLFDIGCFFFFNVFFAEPGIETIPM